MAGASLRLPGRGPPLRAGLVAVLVVLLAAPAALAHPVGLPHGAYRATVTGVQPPTPGLQLAVLGGDRRLRLFNQTGKTVLILGGDGQPFLRFTSNAVYTRTADGGWDQVATGATYDWAEPRIGWNRTSAPEAVATAPGEPHFIRDWAVPGQADGQPFRIVGSLEWAPHATGSAAADPASGRAFLIAFGLTAVAILAAVLLYVSRRRTSSSSRSA